MRDYVEAPNVIKTLPWKLHPTCKCAQHALPSSPFLSHQNSKLQFSFTKPNTLPVFPLSYLPTPFSFGRFLSPIRVMFFSPRTHLPILLPFQTTFSARPRVTLFDPHNATQPKEKERKNSCFPPSFTGVTFLSFSLFPPFSIYDPIFLQTEQKRKKTSILGESLVVEFQFQKRRRRWTWY